MLQLAELNREYCEQIRQDRKVHAKSALKEISYMNGSTAKYHGRCVSTLYVPKMFTTEDIAYFRQLIKELYGIFDKVIDHYRSDSEYRILFGYDKLLEDLIFSE